jgi:hypothetical protein
MKRQYSRNLKCSHEGCNEVGHYSFNTQRDLADHCKRVSTYTCVRHLNPLSVLGINNLTTSAKLVCKVKLKDDGNPLGKFWQEEKDFGTDKVSSGFQYGNGYKAYAEDFPEGTEITITASVYLPRPKDSE